MPRPDQSTRIDETDAKGGSKEGVVRWVLAASLVLAVIAMTVIWVTGALTQGPVESQMNVERKAQAEREQAEQGGGGLAEEQGLVSPGTNQQAQSPVPVTR